MKRKTLKHKIHQYISRKKDICCENDIDRKIVVQQIIQKYKSICKDMNEPDEYLNYINNDLVKMIGYKVDLKRNKDIEGVKLWDELDKAVNKQKIEDLLQDVPLYFLLSFLGYASYKDLLANNRS